MKAFAGLCLLALLPRLAAEDSITVHAGEDDRFDTVVTFQAPAWMKGQSATLHGLGTPVQVDEAGLATFMLSELPKGKSATYTFSPALPTHGASGIETEKGDGTLSFIAKPYNITPEKVRKPVFTYQMLPGPVPEGTNQAFAHGAHLHPVFSPSGRLVTGNHPSDHPHQRGIWFAWTHTEFEGGTPDFWNMGKDKSGKLTGEVRFDKLIKSWGGPVHGGFVSSHRWIDHTSGTEKDVLKEEWQVKVFHTLGRNTPLYLIDLTSTQTCSGNAPVKLPKYHYGGLGVRGNALWDAVDKVTMLTSNGDDRIKGDGSKAKWVWLGGDVDQKAAGITVLIHPENFRFPQPLRLNPKNPQLCVAPSADGDWSIEPGKPLVSRYRIVISDGKADPVLLERLWNDYANPPKVEVH